MTSIVKFPWIFSSDSYILEKLGGRDYISIPYRLQWPFLPYLLPIAFWIQKKSWVPLTFALATMTVNLHIVWSLYFSLIWICQIQFLFDCFYFLNWRGIDSYVAPLLNLEIASHLLSCTLAWSMLTYCIFPHFETLTYFSVDSNLS